MSATGGLGVARLDALVALAAERAAAGDRAGARDAYRDAVRIAPARADLWHNLGAFAAAQGDRDEALAALAEAARLHDRWAEPWHARGHVLFAAGDFEGARAAFEAAVARDPAHVGAHANLALTLHRLQRWTDALAPLERARALAPADETLWWLLRGNLLLLRRDAEALADFRRFEAHSVAPTARTIAAALAAAIVDRDAAGENAALTAACAHRFAPGESALLAEVLSHVQYADVAPAALAALYRDYDALMRAELAAAGETAPLAPPAARRGDGADRRIRIGYVSADFRAHVMGALWLPVLAAHDRAQFDVRLYSLAPPASNDATTAALRAAVDAFTSVAAQNDAMAARTIAADDLDLLVDLMGHTTFARPGILARKPARVVLTHLGQHGCLGLSAVDYKVTDPLAAPTGGAEGQIEAFLPLSVCVLPLAPYRPPAPRWTRAALDIDADAVVLEAFVGIRKLSPRCLALWRAVLDAAPSAVLLLSPQRDTERAALLQRLRTHGIAPARVRFVPYDPAALHDRHALADAALDTLPYAGGDTTAAALAAGVPVVTRAGARLAERMGASILGHAGLPQLVADNDAAYVALAVRLATDAAFRAAQREAVRAAFAETSLTRPAIYARALETAYLRALTEQRRLPH